MYDLNIKEFLTNKYFNIDADDSRNVNYLSDLLFDCEENIKKQFLLTIKCDDKIDYLKEFIFDDVFVQLIDSEYIDKNMFFQTVINFLDNCFYDFLNVRISDNIIINTNDYSPEQIFVHIYYALYKKVILDQSFITELIYNSFSYLNSKQIENVEHVLNKSIQKFHNKAISKKYKLKSTNYILDLNEIFSNNEDIYKIIMETDIFLKYGSIMKQKDLEDILSEDITISDLDSNNIEYYNNDILYNLFYKNLSKYNIRDIFMHLLKYDESLAILINQVEVLALQRSFEVK